MKRVKVVIEIQNRTIRFVYANANLEYVIVDYDNLKKGLHSISVPLESEAIEDPLYQCYSEDDPEQAEVRENLKRMKF